MVLFAKASGWPLESYWHPGHPVQRLALETISALSDIPVSEIATAVDGCGVVTFGMPLRGLALAFARLADPSAVADPPLRSALTRIRDAMMSHPELVAGERGRIDTAVMRAFPKRLVSKGGAEGVQAMGLPPGALPSGARFGDGPMGIASTIEDGNWARRGGDADEHRDPQAGGAGGRPAPRAAGRARHASDRRSARRGDRRGAAGVPIGLSATPRPRDGWYDRGTRCRTSHSAVLRARMAPSPTGPLHIGSARTSLYNFLAARHDGGSYVLRIEDTDEARNSLDFESDIIEGLHWLGITWDEGPQVAGGDDIGPYAPYRQSQRMETYASEAQRLLDSGAAYRCYCTTEELDAVRREQEARHEPPRYDGRCLNLTDAEREAFEAEGTPSRDPLQGPAREDRLRRPRPRRGRVRQRAPG